MCVSAAEQQDYSETIHVCDDYSRERQEPQQLQRTEEAVWRPSGDVYGLHPVSPLYIPLPRDSSLELSGARNRSTEFLTGTSLHCTRGEGLLNRRFKITDLKISKEQSGGPAGKGICQAT